MDRQDYTTLQNAGFNVVFTTIITHMLQRYLLELSVQRCIKFENNVAE